MADSQRFLSDITQIFFKCFVENIKDGKTAAALKGSMAHLQYIVLKRNSLIVTGNDRS